MDSVIYEVDNKADYGRSYMEFGTNNSNIGLHFHEELEIIFVTSGEIELEINKKQYTAKEQQCVLILPGEVHSVTTENFSIINVIKAYAFWITDEVDFYSISLDNSVFSDEVIASYMYNIYHEYISKKKGYHIAIEKNILEVILYIIRNNPINVLPTDKRYKSLEDSIFLWNVYNYVQKNYMNDILLSDVAELFGYSKCYFSRKFKALTNWNFWDYLTKFRINKAKELIVMTNSNYTEIAAKCGFSEIRSFNRSFKKMTGLTPSQYRKNNHDNIRL